MSKLEPIANFLGKSDSNYEANHSQAGAECDMIHDADNATFLGFFLQKARCCRASLCSATYYSRNHELDAEERIYDGNT
jgi:hypothetical protein